MNALLKRLTTPSAGWFFLFAALFGGCMVYVFFPVLPWDWVMLSPDFPKYYPAWTRIQYLEALLTGKDGVVPMTLVNFLIPPLAKQELFFMLTSFFAAFSVFYYLRSQRLSRLSAYGGGLFFAFSGYSFTLFCAGHGGYFMLISWVLFAFGLINRCFQTKNLFYFAMLGATLIWSEIHQPDIWLLFVFLIAAYVIWRSVREWRETREKTFLWKVYPRFLMTVLVMLLIGSRQIKLALTETLAAREQQFSEASAVLSGAPGSDDPQVVEQKKLERWIFSTNWSLPPEDLLEFIVPGIFGNDSFQRPYPYWGRLGQPYGFQKGKMMPNYRQHTVYLGIVSVLFAWFGIWCWLATRKKALPVSEKEEKDPEAPCFSDVPFWIGAWVVCAVFALGRYTPIYSLVYHLPFMNYLRAPVKFHHLVEVANAFLAAYGIEYLLRAHSLPLTTRKKFVFFIATGLIGLIIGFAWIQANAVALERHIASLGFGPLAVILREYAGANLIRSAVVLGLAMLSFLYISRKTVSTKGVTLMAALAIALSTIDLASVARRHVIPINVGPHHAANAVVTAMLARTEGKPANVMNFVTSNAGEQDWFSMAMDLHGFSNMMPKPDKKDEPLSRLFTGLRNDPIRYWQLTGCRFVLLSRKNVEPLVQQKVLSIVCDFEIGPGTVRLVDPSESSLVVAEIVGFPVLPALYFDWNGPVPAGEQIPYLVKNDKPNKPVADVATGSEALTNVVAQRVQFDEMRKMPFALSTHGRLTAEHPGLLIFNEPFSPELEAYVDDIPARVYLANDLWAAVQMPQGAHQIVLRQKRAWKLNAISLLTSLLVLGWCGVRLRSRPNN